MYTSTYDSDSARACRSCLKNRSRLCLPLGTVARTAYRHHSMGALLEGLISPCALLFDHITISSRTVLMILSCLALTLIATTSFTSTFITYLDAFGYAYRARPARRRKRASILTRALGPITSRSADSPSSTMMDSPSISILFVVRPLKETSSASVLARFRADEVSSTSTSSSSSSPSSSRRAPDVEATLLIVNLSKLARIPAAVVDLFPEPFETTNRALALRNSTPTLSNTPASKVHDDSDAADHADDTTASAICSIISSRASRRLSKSSKSTLASVESESSKDSSSISTPSIVARSGSRPKTAYFRSNTSTRTRTTRHGSANSSNASTLTVKFDNVSLRLNNPMRNVSALMPSTYRLNRRESTGARIVWRPIIVLAARRTEPPLAASVRVWGRID